MKKILVLFTGGTIGSITTDGIIDVEQGEKYAVVEAYKSAYGDDVEFECRQVLNILSENMGFSEWEKMIHEINSIDTLYTRELSSHTEATRWLTLLLCLECISGILIYPFLLSQATSPLARKVQTGFSTSPRRWVL